MSDWSFAVTMRDVAHAFAKDAIWNAKRINETPHVPNIGKKELASVLAIAFATEPQRDVLFVKGHLVKVIEDNAPTLPDSITFDQQMVPATAGFMWLDKPATSITLQSQRSVVNQQPLHGIVWVSWTDAFPEYPHLRPGVWMEGVVLDNDGDLYPILGFSIDYGEPLDAILDRMKPARTNLETGEAEAILDDPVLTEQCKALTRFLYSTFVFIHQRIATTAHPKLTRQQRRALERENKTWPTVHVVTLRRELQEAYDKGGGTPLQYRIPVRAHWRRYHVGTKRSRTEWRLIDLYWRGPENAPRKPVLQRVFDARR